MVSSSLQNLPSAHSEAANRSNLLPPTWAAEAFHLNPPHLDWPGFLKHRHGVKWNALHDVDAVACRHEGHGQGRERFVRQGMAKNVLGVRGVVSCGHLTLPMVVITS